jgi:hypothetical protein
MAVIPDDAHGPCNPIDDEELSLCRLVTYPILSALPHKFARFLFELQACRFESLDLPHLPADRSDFDVHGALLDDKVHQIMSNLLLVVCIYQLS